ncbi:sphingosine kinase 1-like [Periophthalmus magnuspinnatus]|uniref:sphingosine kinase 1-like n=1 Tax=Periophthalmus magnuspinnatus TaxID=409849 RepID=UPI00243638C9|nr:sphingosine kinase 1-like [Periophthalmus magnuspinnatus]
MEPDTAPPDCSPVTPHVTLYGEFTAAGNRRVRYAVSLTEQELVVQRLSSAPVPWNKVLLRLEDCVGSRAHCGDDSDPAAYFTAYFYPLKKRWVGSGSSRQRVEQCFRLAALQDPRCNLEEADKWARAVRERSARKHGPRDGLLMSEPLHRHTLVLVNPQSGRGQALSLYNSHIQRMLQEAGLPHSLLITERQNHARELVRDLNLAQWDTLVIMSGDGLLFEVINGLLERPDWWEAIRMPLAILPGGSGNALAASVHHYSGSSPVSSEELLVSCGFLLCKGLVSRMDLVSIHLSSGARVFSFLSLAWGFVADVDIESEKYRHVGAARFTVGTLVRLACLRVYRGRLSYLLPSLDNRIDQNGVQNTPLPASSLYSFPHENCSPISEHNSCHSNNSVKVTRRLANLSPSGPVDSLLPPLDHPVPNNWVVVPQEEFVLMLAMYQSHLAEDLFAAPDSTLDDGLIHLFYVKAGISRAALLRLFLAMEKGAHLTSNCPHLVHVKVRALRLEPQSPKGIITVDGEVVEYGPVQAEVHRGLARLITG